jgi:hypothetical protein
LRQRRVRNVAEFFSCPVSEKDLILLSCFCAACLELCSVAQANGMRNKFEAARNGRARQKKKSTETGMGNTSGNGQKNAEIKGQ